MTNNNPILTNFFIGFIEYHIILIHKKIERKINSLHSDYCYPENLVKINFTNGGVGSCSSGGLPASTANIRLDLMGGLLFTLRNWGKYINRLYNPILLMVEYDLATLLDSLPALQNNGRLDLKGGLFLTLKNWGKYINKLHNPILLMVEYDLAPLLDSLQALRPLDLKGTIFAYPENLVKMYKQIT